MCLEKLCSKTCEMHKSPVNCLLHLVAAIIAIYALWAHKIGWILIAILIALIGHIIQIASKKRKKKR